jgi:fructokinase
MLQSTNRWPTGTASVQLDATGQPTFSIPRPAAYDAVDLSDADIALLTSLRPSWLYYGTLFPSTSEGKQTLLRVLDALPGATRFYDVNLRVGFDSPELVTELLARAAVVKMNESEMSAVSQFSGLPSQMEGFCRAAAERFGWRAVCVTLGERGCAVLADRQYAVAEGYPVAVADSIGAGDAFAAAFVHGLSQGWPVGRLATFANRVGSLVASRVGATPDWNVAEMAEV